MFLRQATASQEVLLGPFVDSTDGNTAETGLTIANTDIKVWKSGGTTEANKNSGGATHIASGRYYAVLDATDTDTVGMLEVNVHVSGALPVRRAFYVLEEAVYDALFAASSAALVGLADGAITAAKIATDAISAAKLASDAIAKIWTTALTESYSTDGAAPTPAQALFVMMQMLTEKAISGTTMTVKRLDGSTTAFTLTLNDATTPTSITRAS